MSKPDGRKPMEYFFYPWNCREAVRRLHKGGYSCVIYSGGSYYEFRERGVRDLYRLLTTEPMILQDSFVADKVVGKGAAAIMVVGKVIAVHADVISRPALALLESAGVSVDYKDCVANIINRAGTGVCPVELLCADCSTAEECIPLIGKFIESMATR